MFQGSSSISGQEEYMEDAPEALRRLKSQKDLNKPVGSAPQSIWKTPGAPFTAGIYGRRLAEAGRMRPQKNLWGSLHHQNNHCTYQRSTPLPRRAAQPRRQRILEKNDPVIRVRPSGKKRGVVVTLANEPQEVGG